MNWDKEIENLEQFYKNREISTPIKLYSHATIMDSKKFIEAHLSTVKANKRNDHYLPYLQRLNDLKDILNGKAV